MDDDTVRLAHDLLVQLRHRYRVPVAERHVLKKKCNQQEP